MILYFSGTGNSKYAAQRIADGLGDTLCSMNERIKAGDTSPVETGSRLVIVTPTYKKIYNVIVSKKFLTPEDHVLIIDDFLANGCALMGLLELASEAGATVEGIGIAVEKGFQGGGDRFRASGIPYKALAVIEKADENGFVFREE